MKNMDQLQESGLSTLDARGRICFVDDERRVLDGLARCLRHMDDEWEMLFVEHPEEALRAVDVGQVDVVVTDHYMPDMTGLELLQSIRGRDHGESLPVVLFTGSAETSLKREALDLGATDLLGKPVDPLDLMARVRSALRSKASQDGERRTRAQLESRVVEGASDLERSRLELIWRLGKAGEYRDNETGNHALRVGHQARLLAQRLGLDESFCDAILTTAPLHDLGKIGVPDRILHKPGKLTEEEWAVMRRHTIIGAEILSGGGESPALPFGRGGRLASPGELTAMAARIALSHHERWDGTGYPYGLRRGEIPIEARITAAADVYDALSSARPYKPAFSTDRVLEIFREGRSTHFDPDVVDALVEALDGLEAVRHDYPDPVTGDADGWTVRGAA